MDKDPFKLRKVRFENLSIYSTMYYSIHYTYCVLFQIFYYVLYVFYTFYNIYMLFYII